MRKIFLVGACIAAMVLGCAAQDAQQKRMKRHKRLKTQVYTAYNIWKHPGTLYCINFKLGHEIIPAGTAVKNVKILKDEGWRYISFQIVGTNQLITISFNERWHPGQTIKSYLRKMFTKKKFDELTRALSPKEIHSIKKGIVTEGMSKEAVLISYGPPPEHYTKDMSRDEWYYWVDRAQKKKICFDENKRAKRCYQASPGSL